MKKLSKWCERNPTRVAATLTILVGWAALVIPEGFVAGLGSLVGIWTGTAVWNAVTPVDKLLKRPKRPAS